MLRPRGTVHTLTLSNRIRCNRESTDNKPATRPVRRGLFAGLLRSGKLSDSPAPAGGEGPGASAASALASGGSGDGAPGLAAPASAPGTPLSRPRLLRERQNSWIAPQPLDVTAAASAGGSGSGVALTAALTGRGSIAATPQFTPTASFGILSPVPISARPSLAGGSTSVILFAPPSAPASSATSGGGGLPLFYDPALLTPRPVTFVVAVNGLLRSLQGWPRRRHARRGPLDDLNLEQEPDRCVASALERANHWLSQRALAAAVAALLEARAAVAALDAPTPHTAAVQHFLRYGCYRLLLLLAYARGMGTASALAGAFATATAAPPNISGSSGAAAGGAPAGSGDGGSAGGGSVSPSRRSTGQQDGSARPTPGLAAGGSAAALAPGSGSASTAPFADELEFHTAYTDALTKVDVVALGVSYIAVDEPPSISHAAIRCVFRHLRP